jgi:catechol 2,3-dioxygenase-like lactoylglutathione lyase family enzyme
VSVQSVAAGAPSAPGWWAARAPGACTWIVARRAVVIGGRTPNTRAAAQPSSSPRSARRFYADVLGGEVLLDGEPSIVALANSWIIINAGGPPTDDKPTVTLEPPRDPDHVSSFLNIRVADGHAVYREWRECGPEFLTPPTDWRHELRCYMRDPDGHLIEVGQSTRIPPRLARPPARR